MRCVVHPPLLEKTLPVTYRSAFLAAVLTAAAFNAVAQGLATPRNAKSPDPDPRSHRPDAPDYSQYEYGKEIYAVKLGCETCPLGEKPLDESTARRFLASISVEHSFRL